MMYTIRVVTDESGDVIATQVLSEATPDGIVARLVAGPKQQYHDIEVEDLPPERFASSDEINEFHRTVRRSITT